MAKLGCAGMLLGILSFLLAIGSKVGHCCAWMGLGPRSYAAAAALFLLLSIAAHACAACCGPCSKTAGK